MGGESHDNRKGSVGPVMSVNLQQGAFTCPRQRWRLLFTGSTKRASAPRDASIDSDGAQRRTKSSGRRWEEGREEVGGGERRCG